LEAVVPRASPGNTQKIHNNFSQATCITALRLMEEYSQNKKLKFGMPRSPDSINLSSQTHNTASCAKKRDCQTDIQRPVFNQERMSAKYSDLDIDPSSVIVT